MSELSPCHVRSGRIMTVDGPIPSSALGHTLMHEHLQNDCRCWWNPPQEPERQYLAEAPISIEILSELRQDPFVNKHNIALDDLDLAIAEVKQFAAVGGRSIVDPTCRGIGRDPVKLRRISAETGVQVVMGAGYYLASSMPETVARLSANDIADEIVAEALEGTDGTDARIGLIGEIGVSSDFTAEEEKSLRGAARAQVRTGLPLMVHLPGWFRLAHRVLDLVEEEGADLRHTVLCHMNPSHMDPVYQATLAQRGAFLEFDMIGMDFFYADQGVQCPSDDEVARAILGLADHGYLDRILLSHDVFVKMMLTRYGGNGYAFVTKHFLPRLRRHGLDDAALETLMVTNPRRVFDASI
ncbi:resiniferatoxin-binding, phosphotriesterase-related protein [Cereibacter sphaeroides WS8N]|uniref:phosphotriesterase family protein n=1 Tax=Cereibacter sphaeroides TaxID=1063 RepID=UPI00020B006C|nr:phosphotriesterase [Cereibacter sphaeroides]EGJ19564.1 resiniferatoxin-binding, phosphotriesterase-related protein [Cereibacter sphaeroides WS8N]